MTPGLAASFLQRWRKLSYVWKYQIVFWGLYTALPFPVQFVVLRYVLFWQAPFYGILFLKVVEILLDIFTTVGFARLMETRWFLRKRAWGRAAYIGLMIGAIMALRVTFVVPVILAPIYQHFGRYPKTKNPEEQTLKRFAANSYFVILYATWAGMFLLVRASAQAKKKERDLQIAELKRKEAEILMLRSQLNPHFLFNAMSTIAYESAGNPKIDQLVEGICDYLRYSLSARTYVPLREEIDATRRFLEVQAIRLGPAMDFEIEADPAGDDVQVPGIFLQTLVENALKYGGRGTPPPLRIRIVSRYVGKDLHVEVANTGEWVPSLPREQRVSGGIGLENLKARLNLFYPERFGFEIRSEDGWTTVAIHLTDPELPEGSGKV